MKVEDKCPYCKQLDCIPEVAFLNCENYGSRFYTVRCVHCDKHLHIYIDRCTILTHITKTDKKITDW